MSTIENLKKLADEHPLFSLENKWRTAITDAIVKEIDKAFIEDINKIDNSGQQKLDKLKKKKNLYEN